PLRLLLSTIQSSIPYPALFRSVRGEQSVSFEQMQASLDRVIAILRKDPAVDTVTAFTGGGSRNRAFMFISLKPLVQGREPAERIDRKSTRLNSSHVKISYSVFC